MDLLECENYSWGLKTSNLNLPVDKTFLIRRLDGYLALTKETGIPFSGIFHSCGLAVTLRGSWTMNFLVRCKPVVL